MTDEPISAELRDATLAGARWLGLARVYAETVALASSIVLARLIAPSEFGRAAIALVVVALAAIIGPAGLTAPLVQRRSLERTDVESAAFLAVAIGAALTALTLVFALLVGRPLFGDRTAELIAIASTAWLISALGAASQARLQRELRFRQIAIIDSASVLVGTATAVGLAVAGVDAVAIVVGALATLAVATGLALVWAPPGWPRPTRGGIATTTGFGSSVALSSLVYAAFRNVDYAILGARLNAAAVGFYWRAYQLGVDYQSKISQVMLRVSFPVYSRAADEDELRRLRTRIVRTHATVIIPLLAAFVAMAPVLVPWVFGSAWESTVRPAQIMAIAGMAYAVATGTGPLMIAVGRPRALLVWNVCELVLYAVLIFVLAPHGLIAVAIGVAAFAVGSLLVIQVFLLRPFAGIPVRQLRHDVAPGVVTGAVVLVVLTLARGGLAGSVATLVVLVVQAALGVAVYAIVLRALFHPAWDDLVSIVRRVGGSPR